MHRAYFDFLKEGAATCWLRGRGGSKAGMRRLLGVGKESLLFWWLLANSPLSPRR